VRRRLEFVAESFSSGSWKQCGLCTTPPKRFVEHLTYHFSFGTLAGPVSRGAVWCDALVGRRPAARLPYSAGGRCAEARDLLPLAAIANNRPIFGLQMTLYAAIAGAICRLGASRDREGALRQFASALTVSAHRDDRCDREEPSQSARIRGLGGLGDGHSFPLGGAMLTPVLTPGNTCRGMTRPGSQRRASRRRLQA
jgi:chloride channel protein, CIC family